MATTNLTELRPFLVTELTGCPWPLVDQTTIDVIRNFCTQTQAWTCDLPAINIRDGIKTYHLDGHPSYSEIIVPIRVQIHKPTEAPTYWQATARQPRWDYIRYTDRCILVLIHEPQADITAGLHVRLALRPKLATTLIDTDLYREHYQTWVHGILEALQDMENKPWTNHASAGKHRAFFWDGIGRARIREIRERTNLPLQAKAKWSFARRP